MRLHFVLAAAAVLASSGLAHADTMSVFNLNATLAYGSASGSITLDQTTGKVTDSTINVTTSAGNATFSGAPTSIPAFGYSDLLFSNSTVNMYAFELALPSASLKNYNGGALCSSTALCSSNASAIQYAGVDADPVTSGTLTLAPAPVAVTPEPSGLLLLGTGVLVLGGFLRKRSF